MSPRDIPRAVVHPDGCVTLHDGWSDAPLHLPTTAMAREAIAQWLAGMDAAEGIEHAAPTTGWVEINASQLRPSTAERNGDTLTDGRRILTVKYIGQRVVGKWINDATDARGLYTFGRKDRVTVLTPRPETDLAEFGKRAVAVMSDAVNAIPTEEHADHIAHARRIIADESSPPELRDMLARVVAVAEGSHIATAIADAGPHTAEMHDGPETAA